MMNDNVRKMRLCVYFRLQLCWGGRGKLKLYEHFKFNYTFQWMKIDAKARTLQMEVLKTLPLYTDRLSTDSFCYDQQKAIL